jgi:hypothetical protein
MTGPVMANRCTTYPEDMVISDDLADSHARAVRARARFLSAYDRGLVPRPAPARELVEQLRRLGYVR